MRSFITLFILSICLILPVSADDYMQEEYTPNYEDLSSDEWDESEVEEEAYEACVDKAYELQLKEEEVEAFLNECLPPIQDEDEND